MTLVATGTQACNRKTAGNRKPSNKARVIFEFVIGGREARDETNPVSLFVEIGLHFMGAGQNSSFVEFPSFFMDIISILLDIKPMKNTIPPQSFLVQAAQIQRMERGKLSVMRQGPNGPYFKLQTWEKGKNVSRYIPPSQAPACREALHGFQEYQQLVEQHARQVIDRTRAEIAAGLKKKANSPRRLPRPKTPNSKS
jgi:hypothetical protein